MQCIVINKLRQWPGYQPFLFLQLFLCHIKKNTMSVVNTLYQVNVCYKILYDLDLVAWCNDQ